MALPPAERAKAARTLLESLDGGSDPDAEQAQLMELARRMRALDAGEVELIDSDEARARVLARIRAIRGR